jgi:hypothetical protein
MKRSLQGCHIGDSSAAALAKALKADWSVTALNLSANEIGDDGAKALAEVLAENPNLTMLDLSNNAIKDKGASELADALRQTAHVYREILLGGNSFGTAGLFCLTRAVAATVSVVGDVPLYERDSLVYLTFSSVREDVVKPTIRSLSALLIDPKDYDLVDVVKAFLKRTSRALAAIPINDGTLVPPQSDFNDSDSA